jgi:two-component system sensor histidine kinase ChiS
VKAILILYTSLFTCFLLHGQNQALKFKHLLLENGLSQSSVTCILKDSRGLMWFGTEDGLNKYDGSNFTVYRHLSTEKESLSSSYINAISEQEDGFLWIATSNGLNYFNPDNEKFTRYLHDPNNPKSLSHNNVNALQLTKDNRLLIGTSDGLSLFDPLTGFSRYTPENITVPYHVASIACDEQGYVWVLSKEMVEKIKFDNGQFSRLSFYKLPENSIKNVLLPDSLNLWIGTSKGLVKFDTLTQKSETFRFYDVKEKEPADNRNYIRPLIYDRNGKLWLGTHGGGLISFDKTTGSFETVLNDPYNRFSLNSNLVGSVFLDEKGILWVGTYGGGINKYDPTQFKFQHYNNQPGNSNSLSDNGVRSVLLDRDGELWVGTHGGLNRINRKTGQVLVYRSEQNNLSTISSNIIRALCEDANGTIWAGAWDNGLNSFDKKTGKFKRYIHFPGRADSIGQVRCLEKDAQGNIWVGGYGLWKFNPESREYKSYFHDKTNVNSLSGNTINRLYFDRRGLLWVGTQSGLNCVDTASGSIRRYLHTPEDTLSISHPSITGIAEDKNGLLWIGTYGGGLDILDVKSGIFQRYNTSNGLLNDVIYAILIDESGFIWFTSNAGLGRFDPQRKEFKYFGVEDGIQSNEFNAGAFFKTKSGEFFFGGINGFNAFYSRNINSKKETSKIVFTDFQILDDKKSLAGKILNKHISRVADIRLSYSQNTFSLKFAELNYSDNADNNYEYQLEGLEKKWNDLGKKKVITIGNLKPGTYTLHVRVRNDLTKKTSVFITVLTPFWQSTWAYVVYALVVIIITALVYRNIRRMKLIREQFEAKIRNWENNAKTPAPFQHLQETGATLQLKTVEVKSVDQRFLERVIKIAEDHIEDTEFDVEKFAGEIFLSRSQLHRKLKTLTGHSATQFIRLIRLKRAAQLLSGNAGTVSEIAYKVGFENIGYFSKCFTETFGVPPSQYKGNASSSDLIHSA